MVILLESAVGFAVNEPSDHVQSAVIDAQGT